VYTRTCTSFSNPEYFSPFEIKFSAAAFTNPVSMDAANPDGTSFCSTTRELSIESLKRATVSSSTFAGDIYDEPRPAPGNLMKYVNTRIVSTESHYLNIGLTIRKEFNFYRAVFGMRFDCRKLSMITICRAFAVVLIAFADV